ncbi:hypothetical protein Taro_054573 [Colocasia esculenta]|uniref:Uncharacterized protein n=1 Tax=Colocasia esculenta TaxID=4460 RepID=A0A843XR33_COLES|nr:hypothetical protein [Colocasia esculenta]
MFAKKVQKIGHHIKAKDFKEVPNISCQLESTSKLQRSRPSLCSVFWSRPRVSKGVDPLSNGLSCSLTRVDPGLQLESTPSLNQSRPWPSIGVDPACAQFFRVDPSSSRESTSVQQKLFSPKGVDLQAVKESTLACSLAQEVRTENFYDVEEDSLYRKHRHGGDGGAEAGQPTSAPPSVDCDGGETPMMGSDSDSRKAFVGVFTSSSPVSENGPPSKACNRFSPLPLSSAILPGLCKEAAS